jgi:hypothetical protein
MESSKYRMIIIETPDKENINFIKAKEKLKKYKKDFDMLSTVVKNKIAIKFAIKLYGLDGKIKYETNKFTSWKEFIKLIKNMPMQKSISKLTLYSDYHPETSLKKTGFKNMEVAKNTIKLLEGKPKTYQFLVINTMYNRAKYHPNQTKEMRQAMKIFKKWLNEYYSNK